MGFDQILMVADILIVGFFLWYFGRTFVNRFLYRKSILTPDQFREGLRTAQVIDLRNETEFRVKHIMGARNIPSNYLKKQDTGLRRDKDVYLYAQESALSGNAAFKAAGYLKKQGFGQVYILKGGFSKWEGKTK
ncbi:MAG: rhodanese-like domain-containing protein [Lactobacillales bacterium]|jgi:rhodanese-related sulfurtransferase|nr:rhodanese-like domain-containing protein [Lactobacillales bacterium]